MTIHNNNNYRSSGIIIIVINYPNKINVIKYIYCVLYRYTADYFTPQTLEYTFAMYTICHHRSCCKVNVRLAVF